MSQGSGAIARRLITIRMLINTWCLVAWAMNHANVTCIHRTSSITKNMTANK